MSYCKFNEEIDKPMLMLCEHTAFHPHSAELENKLKILNDQIGRWTIIDSICIPMLSEHTAFHSHSAESKNKLKILICPNRAADNYRWYLSVSSTRK